MAKKALIIVDLQNDFCPGGSLAVAQADDIVPLANKLQTYFDLIIATQDWHPQDHISFATNHPNKMVGDMILVDDIPQVLWPSHCIQYSRGAQFHPKFDTHKIHKIFHKGTDKNIDSYSAFFDNEHKKATGLAEYLLSQRVKDIYIMGLATDYCVKYSTLDAAKLGFNVYVIEDGCRGVELNPGDIDNAYSDMQAVGAKIVTSNDIFNWQSHQKSGAP